MELGTSFILKFYTRLTIWHKVKLLVERGHYE